MRFDARSRLAATLALALATAPATAAELVARVVDAAGAPLAEAVVAVISPTPGVSLARPVEVVVDQVNRRFVPRVTAITRGSRVSFPNSDDVRHHVYSFSEPKRFQIKLYHGMPRDPVEFDHPGLVVLGCNIHDRMVGYVYVLDTPWFAMTDETGVVHLGGLPDGPSELLVWHPVQAPGEGTRRAITVGTDTRIEVTVDTPAVAGPEVTLDAVERRFKALRDARR